MLKQIKKMQEDMKRIQAQINESTFYGHSGGQVVTVSVKGTKEVISIKVKKDEIDFDDFDMIQDMIVVALNDAFKKVDKEFEENLGAVAKDVNMPGMF
jgi:hypothetical protein